jgi:hypothetical protein
MTRNIGKLPERDEKNKTGLCRGRYFYVLLLFFISSSPLLLPKAKLNKQNNNNNNQTIPSQRKSNKPNKIK